jgi:hypothetical protein
MDYRELLIRVCGSTRNYAGERVHKELHRKVYKAKEKG